MTSSIAIVARASAYAEQGAGVIPRMRVRPPASPGLEDVQAVAERVLCNWPSVPAVEWQTIYANTSSWREHQRTPPPPPLRARATRRCARSALPRSTLSLLVQGRSGSNLTMLWKICHPSASGAQRGAGGDGPVPQWPQWPPGVEVGFDTRRMPVVLRASFRSSGYRSHGRNLCSGAAGKRR